MTVDDSAQKIHTKSGILTQHCQQCHTQTVDTFLGQIDPEKIGLDKSVSDCLSFERVDS